MVEATRERSSVTEFAASAGGTGRSAVVREVKRQELSSGIESRVKKEGRAEGIGIRGGGRLVGGGGALRDLAEKVTPLLGSACV